MLADGRARDDGHVGQYEDLTGRELVMMISLMLLSLAVGLYPQPVLDASAATIKAVQYYYQGPIARTAAAVVGVAP